MLFLDPHTRGLYRRWDEEASRSVASLRLVAGRFPDDEPLTALIGELTVKSGEFAALWARHPVSSCVNGTKYLHHPEVGECEFDFEMLQLSDESGQRLLTYTAAPGSPSDAALRLLRAVPTRLPAEPLRRSGAARDNGVRT
jgi:hypothetical protein